MCPRSSSSSSDDVRERSTRWAIVLGASRGIGLACAERLAADGYNLCLVYRESRAHLAMVSAAFADLERLGSTVLHFNTDAISDVGRKDVLDQLQSALKHEDHVAVLVHSLAKGALKPLITECATDNQWPEGYDRQQPSKAPLTAGGEAKQRPVQPLSLRDLQLTIDAMGSSLLSWVNDLRLRQLLASDMRVIALTSEGARRAWPGYAAVSAAKAVLESLVRSIALELGPSGVRANCVQAGVCDTQALRQIPGSEQLKLHALSRNPMGRLTTPDDVAQVVALLCRPEAAWINGTLLIADGGEHLC